jgi:hypothetical protein
MISINLIRRKRKDQNLNQVMKKQKMNKMNKMKKEVKISRVKMNPAMMMNLVVKSKMTNQR